MKWSALGKKEAESLQHGFEKGSLTKPAGRIEADPLFALDADGRKKKGHVLDGASVSAFIRLHY